jgi:hypothetical protein
MLVGTRALGDMSKQEIGWDYIGIDVIQKITHGIRMEHIKPTNLQTKSDTRNTNQPCNQGYGDKSPWGTPEPA